MGSIEKRFNSKKTPLGESSKIILSTGGFIEYFKIGNPNDSSRKRDVQITIYDNKKRIVNYCCARAVDPDYY